MKLNDWSVNVIVFVLIVVALAIIVGAVGVLSGRNVLLLQPLSSHEVKDGWTFTVIDPRDIGGLVVIHHLATGTCLVRPVRQGSGHVVSLVLVPKEVCQ